MFQTKHLMKPSNTVVPSKILLSVLLNFVGIPAFKLAKFLTAHRTKNWGLFLNEH
jgi:hypothetical protein